MGNKPNMTLTPEEVEHIAKLARLELPTAEKDALTRQLSSILDYVGALGSVETDGVEPMAHSMPVRNVFGADEPAPCPPATREALLGEFPEREGDMLKVKAVFS
jgi:aspartyl-tRNA(Asn)/glutamyl-tRNA(Gln) amidotransferase subunit C